jgi:hypothetical protein
MTGTGWLKKIMLSSALALTLSVGSARAADIFVRIGPPPSRREVIVARPGPRYVWVQGYQRWDGRRYMWAPGQWVLPPRHRSAWVPGYWAQRPRGYVFVEGHWR